MRLLREFDPIATNETVVVVPCYNEANRLNQLQFTSFLNSHPRISIIFVDDGSSDGTGDVLAKIKDRNEDQVEILSLDQNRGKAVAVWHGLQQGFKKYPSYIAYWDADLATPLSEVLRFRETLKQLSHVQLLIGSRNPMMGHVIERKPSRKILSYGFSIASRALMGIRAKDTQCGAKMFRVSKELRDVLAKPFQSKWLFDVEILARFKNSNDFTEHCVFELGLARWVEINGSKIKLRDLIRFPWDLLRLVISYRLRFGRNSHNEKFVPSTEVVALRSTDVRKAA